MVRGPEELRNLLGGLKVRGVGESYGEGVELGEGRRFPARSGAGSGEWKGAKRAWGGC